MSAIKEAVASRVGHDEQSAFRVPHDDERAVRAGYPEGATFWYVTPVGINTTHDPYTTHVAPTFLAVTRLVPALEDGLQICTAANLRVESCRSRSQDGSNPEFTANTIDEGVDLGKFRFRVFKVRYTPICGRSK